MVEKQTTLIMWHEFYKWAKKQGFTKEELEGPLHELSGCWMSAWDASEKNFCKKLSKKAKEYKTTND